ncbi:glycosyltransferase family 2 protein [Leclercia sp. G3L]|uniref:glycosyltransferase family 2 protein n=1 Tax=Leclercia sp. G3L TaxID=2898725 RepID=UPI001E52D91F|nr:glycosyltransferase family 2 protein [Leclercia sp. G3L]UGB01006.1 glycosyltransferase family 2 protein [Leclercia sp. G3L]
MKMIKIAVIIICYYPDNQKLSNLINACSHENGMIYIANNGGINEEEVSAFSSNNVKVISFNQNLGLGKAINTIASSLDDSVEVIFTFDQDSAPPLNYIDDVWHHYLELMELKVKLGVLTPRFIDARSGEEYNLKPLSSGGGYTELLITLQSGMCIPRNTWEQQRFNSELFIEFVDTEWCYRIASKGFKILQMNDVIMHHEVSEKAPVNFLGFKLLKYKPIRRYYFYRNAVFLIKQEYVPTYNKARLITGAINRLLSIFLLDDNKGKSLREASRGIIDGFKMSKRK